MSDEQTQENSGFDLDGTLAYVRSFFKDKNVASVTPTSANVVRQICDRMDFTSDCVVIEYGAGTGVFTFELLRRMTPDSKLLAFETNEELAAVLGKSEDPRLIVSTESAELVSDIRSAYGLGLADYILSGIPFTFLSATQRASLLAATKATLRPGGRFLAYQASWFMKDKITEVFGNCETDKYLLNIPPMFLMDARKD